MPALLLKTKLYIPPMRSDLVSRPRLIERLNAGPRSGRKLTLVSAPAGYGKTTLLSAWAQQPEPRTRVAWLSLDDNDNEPARFLTHLIAAVQGIDEGIGVGVQAALQVPQPPSIETLLTRLINEIAATPNEFTLVLDDYHAITAQSIHDALHFLLDHLPPVMHLVVAGRVDPPLPLARFRVRGQMIELRSPELRFSRAEVATFLNDLMGLDLSPEDIAALEARTEGWIASLHLAALSLQGHQDRHGFIAAFSGSHRHIMDYLVDDVIARQPQEIQTFLRRTSILERLCAPLCDAILEVDAPTGRHILRELEAANLFLIPLDDTRHWYRYHQLFAEFLRQHLREKEPHRILELHRRAAAWHEQNGFIPEAVSHALAAGHPEDAADIIEPVALTMVAQSKLPLLLGWLTKLPSEMIAARPWLCVARAWAYLLTGQVGAVDRTLQPAESILSDTTPESFADHSRIYGHVKTLRAFIARGQGDFARTIELSHEAFTHLPEKSRLARSALALNLGIAYLATGELAAAGPYLSQARAIGQESGNFYVALTAISYMAKLQAMQGHLHQAAEIYRQALQLGAEWGAGQPLPATGYACVGLSQVLYQWNELDEAADHLRRGIELGQQADEVAIVLMGYLAFTQLKLARGEINAASEALDQARELAPRAKRVPEASQIPSWQARIWLAPVGGDLALASRWSDARARPTDDEPDYLHIIEHLTLARVLIAQASSAGSGRGEASAEALELLARLLKAEEAGGRTGNAIEILALQALALQAQGDIDEAINALQRALSLAAPKGYVRVFVDEGQPMADLLNQAASRGVAPSYVEILLAAVGDTADDREPMTQAQAPSFIAPPSSLVEPLSERECQVLRLMAVGLKYQHIAEQLFVSVNTVRFHTKNIYSKLGVHNRAQAIARARELTIL